MSGYRGSIFGNILGSSHSHHPTPGSSTFGSHINDIVSTLDYVHIVFYHYHCVAFIHKAVEHVEKYLNILKMQSCGRLIENKHRVARTLASKFGCELHKLAFSSRQCTRWLSELDVSKPYILQHLYLLENLQ